MYVYIPLNGDQDDDENIIIDADITPDDLKVIAADLSKLSADPDVDFARDSTRHVRCAIDDQMKLNRGLLHLTTDKRESTHNVKLGIALHNIAMMNVVAAHSGIKPGSLICVRASSLEPGIRALQEKVPSYRWRLGTALASIESGSGISATPVMVLVSVANATKCSKCGMIVEANKVAVHGRGWDCRITEAKTDAEKDGLIEVDPSIAYEVIKAIGIDVKLVPTRYTVYAPKWVKDTIKLFNENKIDGLTLSEMLNKASSKE